MSDPLIHDCENYVVLEPGKNEIILNANDTKKWLEKWLNEFEQLPSDLEDQASISEAANRLMDTACSLEIEPGFNLQWFAVRMNPPEH